MINNYVQTQDNALVEYEKHQKSSLQEMAKIITEISSSMAGSFIYNFDQENLKALLSSFIKIDGIIAIKALDADDTPFAAAWDDSGIKTGVEIPSKMKLKKDFFLSRIPSMMEKKIGTITIYYTDLLVKKDIAQKQATTKQSISGFNAIAGKSIKGSIQTQIFDNITSKHLGG